jgi:AcrR family transcriptional regulator
MTDLSDAPRGPAARGPAARGPAARGQAPRGPAARGQAPQGQAPRGPAARGAAPPGAGSSGADPRIREARVPASTPYGDGVTSSEHGAPKDRPARRRLAPDDRRQALINSALKLFNTRPYDEVSVDDIAADAGMSRPLVYHYYGGKAGVFITALKQTGDDVVAAICEAGLRDPDNWLSAGLAAFFDHIQANPIGLTALLRHGALTGGEDRQVLDDIRDQVLALILAGLKPPSDSAVLQSVLRGWIAMVETMGREWLGRGEPTREELETLLPELLRAVLGTAAWHDAAVAAVLPNLPPRTQHLATDDAA